MWGGGTKRTAGTEIMKEGLMKIIIVERQGQSTGRGREVDGN